MIRLWCFWHFLFGIYSLLFEMLFSTFEIGKRSIFRLFTLCDSFQHRRYHTRHTHFHQLFIYRFDNVGVKKIFNAFSKGVWQNTRQWRLWLILSNVMLKTVSFLLCKVMNLSRLVEAISMGVRSEQYICIFIYRHCIE